MSRYYIQVEAVNLNHFVYDTHDISTIRGGSFLLLESIYELEKRFDKYLTPISTAASQGVFRVEFESVDDEDEVIRDEASSDEAFHQASSSQKSSWWARLFSWLGGASDRGATSGADVAGSSESIQSGSIKDEIYHTPAELELGILEFLKEETGGHATFITAVEEEEDEFALVLQRLQATIRRKQLQMPTVAIPQFVDGVTSECFLDGWRPAADFYDGQWDGAEAERPLISGSTSFRRARGRDLKHDVIQRILKNANDDLDKNSAGNLGDLSDLKTKGVLHHKIAYIYVDGNAFGKIRGRLCRTDDARRDFDKAIQDGCREPFLERLIAEIDSDSEQDLLIHKDDGSVERRFELLLWGGDEFVIVVPAWYGFRALELFYEEAAKLTFMDTELSHRAALVFAHHNAPILQVRRIAEELLGETRQNIAKRMEVAFGADDSLFDEMRAQMLGELSSHVYGNGFQYLVLKSFDMIRGSLEEFLTEYYRLKERDKLLLYAGEFKDVVKNLSVLHRHLARGKVLEVIDGIGNEQTVDPVVLRKELLRGVSPAAEDELAAPLKWLLDGPDAQWHWVADLWGYIPVRREIAEKSELQGVNNGAV